MIYNNITNTTSFQLVDAERSLEIMSEKICDLISNEVKRMAYSDNAHNNIGKFRMENIVQEWIKLLS